MDEMEIRIRALEAQVLDLRRRMKLVSDWHNTLDSPWYKRLWFVIQGYKPLALGTWYTAPWNKSTGEKYKDGI